jgi:carboxyl-terminal processing protease
VSRYYTPSGRAIQADGIHPDIIVRTSKEEAAPLSYREKDLEGHLAAERVGTQLPKTPTIVIVAGDAGAPAIDTVGKEARGVPDDPSTGSDAILKVGWETLHRALLAPPPPG